MSLTVTVKLHVDVFPVASVAIEFTEVIPIGNKVPEAGIVTKLVTEQLSVAPIV